MLDHDNKVQADNSGRDQALADLKARSRRAALLQLAADDLRRAELAQGRRGSSTLAGILERMAARLLVSPSAA